MESDPVFLPVHEAYTQLHGDGEMNPRDMLYQIIGPDKQNLGGVFRHDGVRPPGSPRKRDRPFLFTLPTQRVNWHAINLEIYRRLQRGETLVGIDFSN